MLRFTLVLVVSAVAAAAGCGPGEPNAGNDAAVQPGTHQLLILTPPGRAIGLKPLEQERLRVRYLDPEGVPVPGETISFSLSGSTGGATLADFHALSDPSGTAELMLTAGAESATFEVEVEAANALAITFEVAVSEAGFVDIEVKPDYQGVRDATAFGRLEALLYYDGHCGDLGPVNGIEPDRERYTTDGFDTALWFANLPADLNYGIAVRGAGPAGETLAWGCAEVDSVQVVPGVTLRLNLTVHDVVPSSAGTYQVSTTVQLSDTPAESLGAAPAPLSDLGLCPYDPVQRLLDCVVDAVAPDGELDCVPESTEDFALEMEDARGLVDAQGCRGSQNVYVEPSLEAEIWSATDATGLARYDALAALAAADPLALQRFRFNSRLTLVEDPVQGRTFAWHLLQKLQFGDYAPGQWVQLSQLGNLILEVAAVEVDYNVGATHSLTLPPRAMTLHPRWAALAVAHALYLAPAGLPREATDLLEALVASIRTQVGPDSFAGCEAVDALICAALAGQVPCPTQPCVAGLGLLADRMTQHWAALLSPAEADLMIAADIPLIDADGDLLVERLGTPTEPASWLMSLSLDDGWATPLSATFSATRIVTPQ